MRRTWVRVLLLLLVGALAWFTMREDSGSPGSAPAASTSPRPSAESEVAPGERAVLDAFEQRRSNVVVEVEGTVQRILDDDEIGSRHQRFILQLSGSHTVLVSHNIDLAPRVPIREADRVAVRGEYEWNERGGVLHWTHRDPRGSRPGGWIRHQGRDYR